MRHRMAGKRLGRSTTHRIAMRRNMAAALFQHGAIRTTEAKAKELRRFVEKLITTAREGTLHARRRVVSQLGQDRAMFDDEGQSLDQSVLQKLFDEIAPRYLDRPGGYTRIIRLAERRIGDAGRQVILQLVEESPPERGGAKGASRRRRRAAKRHEAGTMSRARAPEAQEPLEPEQAPPAEDDEAEDQTPEVADEAPAEDAAAPAEPAGDEPAGDEQDDKKD